MDARSKLGVSKSVFEASRISEFLGSHAPNGQVSVAAVEHFRRCDTRWRYDLGEWLVPEGTRQAIHLPPEAGERQPPGTKTCARTLTRGTLPRDVRGDLDGDPGWLVRFRSRPDRLFSPGPTETIPVDPLPSNPARR